MLVVLVLVNCFMIFSTAQEYHIKANVSILSTYVAEVMETALGVEELQKLVDQLRFKWQRIDGHSYINTICDKISIIIDNRVAALRQLQDVLHSSLDAHSQTWQPCCKYEKSQLTKNDNYKTDVNTNEMCEIIASTAPRHIESLSSSVLEAMKANQRVVPDIKWQYVGTEQGVMTLYPASLISNCSTIDPRFRPWYIDTAWPRSKRILFLLDISRSMQRTYNSQTLIEIAIQLIQIVLGTLRPNDKVGAIAFHNQAVFPMGCFQNQLTLATESNKLKLMEKFLKTLVPVGESSYKVAFENAFQLLNQDYQNEVIQNEIKNGAPNYAVMLITDGEPKEAHGNINAVYSVIKEGNKRIGNSAVVFSYALGRNVNYGILEQLSKAANVNQSKNGNVFLITEPNDIRKIMSDLNQALNNSTYVNEPVFSVPYIDAGGLGLILTIGLPVHIPGTNTLYGVVAIDITLQDIFKDAIYFNNGDGSYIFIIDNKGRVIFHPSMPALMPSDSVNYYHINQLERGTNFGAVIESMIAGQSGSKAIDMIKVLPVGGTVNSARMKANLFWKSINGTKFSICFVSKVNAEKNILEPKDTFSSITNQTFQYHRLDLASSGKLCQRFYKTATVSKSTVLFAPKSFRSPFNYEAQDESEFIVAQYTSFFNELFESKSNSSIQEVFTKYRAIAELFSVGVISDVLWSSFVDHLWVKQSENHVSARFVGTANGVDRIYPGTRLPKIIDVTKRVWYEQSVAKPKHSVFSPPYRDAAGPGNVITISHAIVAKSYSNLDGEKVIGVVGIDFSLYHLYTKLTDLYPNCKGGNSWYCILVDNFGNVILHKDYINANEDDIKVKHIASDKALLTLLQDANFITRKRCLDLSQNLYRIWYELHPNASLNVSKSNNQCSQYFLQSVANTNLYLVARPNKDWCFNQDCRSKSQICSNRSGSYYDGTWQCPCSYPVDVDACDNVIRVDEDIPTCYPERPELIPFSECIQDSLPKCITASCHLSKSAANCSGQVGCTWCHQSSDATRFLPNPYCTLTEDCYKGVEFARLPGYESREVCADPAADSIRLKTILACVGGSILLLLLLALAIYCFKQKRRKAKCENVDHEYDKVCPGSPSNDKTSESQEQTSKEKSSKSAPRVIISVVDSDGSEILRKPVQLVQGGVTYGAPTDSKQSETHKKNKNQLPTNPKSTGDSSEHLKSRNPSTDGVSDDSGGNPRTASRSSVISTDTQPDNQHSMIEIRRLREQESTIARKHLTKARARSRENIHSLDGAEEAFPLPPLNYVPMKQANYPQNRHKSQSDLLNIAHVEKANYFNGKDVRSHSVDSTSSPILMNKTYFSNSKAI